MARSQEKTDGKLGWVGFIGSCCNLSIAEVTLACWICNAPKKKKTAQHCQALVKDALREGALRGGGDLKRAVADAMRLRGHLGNQRQIISIMIKDILCVKDIE